MSKEMPTFQEVRDRETPFLYRVRWMPVDMNNGAVPFEGVSTYVVAPSMDAANALISANPNDILETTRLGSVLLK